MKIAFLTYVFPALSESFILNQVTGLIDLGHDVDIITFKDPGENKTHPDVEKYNLKERTFYIPPKSSSKFIDLLHASYLISKYIFLYPRHITGFIKSFIQRESSLSIQRLHLLIYCLKNKYDVIHCNFGPLGLEGIFLKKAGLKSIVSTAFHGNDISRNTISNRMDYYHDLFLQGDLFLPISDFWKDTLLKHGCPENKTHLHRMGIDIKRFNFRYRTISPSAIVNLLTVGRLVEKKGHEFSIRAVSALIKKGYDIKYTIAGDGPLKDSLLNLASDLDISDSVCFTGQVQSDEVINLFDDSDIFILPSVCSVDGDMEGIPIVLMEAMACGVPVISTRHSGIPELIQHGYSGFLVEERNTDELSDAIEKLILNSTPVKQITDNAYETISRSYNLPGLCKSLENIFSASLHQA